MPKTVHPVNQDERCPYLMIEEEVISCQGVTVDIVQHKNEKGDKKLYVIGLPDGKGGHYYEVKGLNHFEKYANNAAGLIQAVAKIKAKAGEISATRRQAVLETVETLTKVGMAPVAIQAACMAQYAVKPEEYALILKSNQTEAPATIA